MHSRACFTSIVFFLFWVIAASGQSIDFQRDIAPILSDHCFQCHGPDENAREADLRLDQASGLAQVTAGNSELLRRVMSDDPDEVMPPPSTKRTLTSQQKQKLAAWIAAGGKWEKHWAFRRPQRPPLAQVTNGTWETNAIDRFVLARAEKVGRSPNPRASRERLLRRVTLDLTGLPPTIAELDAFLAATDEDAYPRVVERLLASPRFGERMAMPWLDASRYADTNGYQGDRERTMWPWRDWVVSAFNKGLNYADFTHWQLAGDLLPNATSEQKLATGFCRNHMINGEGGRIPEENRVEYVFDQIETVGTIWMGLTVQCCRCHDHKFDALSQRDYYRLFAIFNQTPVNGGGGDPQMAPTMAAPTQGQSRRLAQLNQEVASTLAALRGVEQSRQQASPELAELLSVPIEERTEEQWKSYFEFGTPPTAELYRNARQQRDALERQFAKVMVMEDRPPDQWRTTYVLEKGLYNQRREEVRAGTPESLPSLDAPQVDRLALARWLTDENHPLTARVTVNRLWQQFFGRGLVTTAEDFGVQGELPSHPQLLDWLATEFQESEWNYKHLVRLIVNSATYQQSARVDADAYTDDPENRLLLRGPRGRMPAWMIRDHALACSGLLEGTLGGASVLPYQPAGVWEEASFGRKKYRQDHGSKLFRRSIYVFWRRIVGPTMFFDTAKRQTCSVRPGQTNTPLHALVTMNDVTYVEAARGLAFRLLQMDASDTTRLEHGYRLTTSRRPGKSQMEILSRRLATARLHFEAQPSAAQSLLKVGEWQPAELTTAPEWAAWTSICLTLLNLDEALTK